MDFLSSVDPLQLAALTFAVVGAVKFVNSLYDRNYRTASTIAIAAVVGAILAPATGDITWFNGLLLGLNASGLVTTVSKIGQ